MSILVKNISKYYGNQKVLSNINFEIKSGEIVGFLGPNGAGKSTMMKIITTYISQNEGIVEVNNFDVVKDPIKVKRSIGYLPEHNPLYLEMYVREYLAYNAEIYKIGKQRIEDIIELVGLKPESHKKIDQLSKGYRQRVGLAAALLHDPEVLILDEPTTGLDPNQLAEIRDLIKEIGKSKTVLLSTHIMQEVEAMCNRVIIINKGNIVADKNLDDLLKNQEQIIEVEFDLEVKQEALNKIVDLKNAQNMYENTWLLTFDSEKDKRFSVFDFAKDNGLRTLHIQQKTFNLETLFKNLTSE